MSDKKKNMIRIDSKIILFLALLAADEISTEKEIDISSIENASSVHIAFNDEDKVALLLETPMPQEVNEIIQIIAADNAFSQVLATLALEGFAITENYSLDTGETIISLKRSGFMTKSSEE